MRAKAAMNPERQKRIIRRFYGLNRVVTDQELADEIRMLKRLHVDMMLDDLTRSLAAELHVI